ncbi:MAG: aldehyde ferredoxin oxidoreductase N-terminal domain-containing protein [Chloroflexota bacterium]
MTDAAHAPWLGRVLHVDLTTGAIERISSLPYLPDYLGGRGLAARLAWEMIPPGVGAFDPENPLMFMPGALVGTPAPSSGRAQVCGLSPQAYPHEWYTRANLGGHWGAELKFAGYDGLIVTGQAPQPVILRIEGEDVRLVAADGLWGQGLIETQLQLRQELGEAWRVVAIGPAGENRCRYAIIATGTESAAGQGGFGAVMGSKRLKAIAVRGRGGVPIAQPAEMLRRARLVMRRIVQKYGDRPTRYGQQDAYAELARPAPCTYNCPGACGGYYHQVPGAVYPERRYSGQLFCCAPRFRGGDWLGASLSFEAAFELAQISNDLGLNHWELTFGLVPWILRLQERGQLRELDGERLDFSDPAFWVTFMRRVSYREGYGEVLAEGGPRAADILGLGHDIIGEYYPAWGQASHWDGHGTFASPYFPYWLVTALQWALDSRDPIGGGHGYTLNVVGLVRALKPETADEEVWRKLDAAGERLYGSALAVDPRSGYEDKAIPAVFHHDRGALKDSLGLCDNIFPFLTDASEPDYLVRVDGVEGNFLEHYLYEAAADLPLDRDAFYRCGARIYAAERLLAVRNWGRNRATDETILSYLRHPEGSVNPLLGEKVPFDVERFRGLLDQVYALRGWDPASASPTLATLRALGMEGLVGMTAA